MSDTEWHAKQKSQKVHDSQYVMRYTYHNQKHSTRQPITILHHTMINLI